MGDEMDTMTLYRRRVVGRSLAGAVLASGALLAVPTMMPRAHAEIGACRSDPTVVLSNGDVLDLSATIADTADDVQRVTYALHGPTGAAIVAVVNTSGPLGPKEAFTFTADRPAGRYVTVTTAATGLGGVSVTATTAIVPLLDLPVSGSASGISRQGLVVRLST